MPGWMWQTMHWLVGMPTVNWCLIGWPGSLRGMVGSAWKDSPWWPKAA